MSGVVAGEWCLDGWNVVWHEIEQDFDHVVVPMARLVVVDPRTSDWRQAVADAMEHARQLYRPSLRLVRDEVGEA